MATESSKLFDVAPVLPDKHCRTCAHRQRWECGSMVIQYCGVRKSNRTDNGLLKIKAKNAACAAYKEEIKNG